MKKFTLYAIIAVASAALTSCGTMGGANKSGGSLLGGSATDIIGAVIGAGSQGTNAGASNSQSSNKGNDSQSQSLLGSLLTGLIGNNTTISYDNIAGTWTYDSPECRFTSENALAQAGGAVAANTVESKLAEIYGKIGIKKGVCSFTFNKDQTCAITLGGRTIAGSYTLNPETRGITITDATGLMRISGQVYYSFTNLAILFDASKLLSTAQMIAAFTGKGSSSIGALSSILNNYQGMMIGMNLTK